jgi:hypothetical protein
MRGNSSVRTVVQAWAWRTRALPVARLAPVEDTIAALVSELREREGSDAGSQLSVAR